MLAGALCGVIRQNPAMAMFLKSLGVTPVVAVLCLAIALFIGFASALVPALGATGTPIADSLRYAG